MNSSNTWAQHWFDEIFALHFHGRSTRNIPTVEKELASIRSFALIHTRQQALNDGYRYLCFLEYQVQAQIRNVAIAIHLFLYVHLLISL